MLNEYGLNRIIQKNVVKSIEKELSRIGILYRIFYRVKNLHSLDSKINKNPEKYSISGKKIQDLFGIRIVLYFSEDIAITQEAITNIFEFDCHSSSIDQLGEKNFSAVRHNLIFKLGSDLEKEFHSCFDKLLPLDSTFEVQLRTVLSEGWHEVDHDLRYKCQEDWSNHDDLGRALNGMLASLETSEWGMKKLFDDLSYRHYKANEWVPMVRTKFRLRAQDGASGDILEILNQDQDLAKKIFRIDREAFLKRILKSKYDFPITVGNIILAVNALYIKDQRLLKLMPPFMEDFFS